MANPRTRWIGSSRIHEQPGSPRVVNTAQGNKTTRIYRGPFSALLNAQPNLGQTIDGSVGMVESVEIVPDGAGMDGPGTMTIVLANDQATYEIEASTLEKPLEKHPLYRPGGDKELSDDDLDKIAAWRTANNSAERKALFTALTTNAKHFVNKLRRGQESYIVPAPIARRTTRSFQQPSPEQTGKRGTPGNFPGLPGGYVWLKTADRAVLQGIRGSWERIEEWTGADEWDTDIYPSNT